MLIVGHGNLPITGFYLTDEECKLSSLGLMLFSLTRFYLTDEECKFGKARGI